MQQIVGDQLNGAALEYRKTCYEVRQMHDLQKKYLQTVANDRASDSIAFLKILQRTDLPEHWKQFELLQYMSLNYDFGNEFRADTKRLLDKYPQMMGDTALMRRVYANY